MRDLFPYSYAAPPTWRWLFPLLAAAFALRVAVGLSPITYVHPDQVFQYLEPAYRLVHGFGFVTWEWVYGIRSWALPFGIAGIIQLADLLGVDHVTLVSIVFSLVSLAIPWGVYRLAQELLSETEARWALGFACVWGFFLHFAATPMPSMLAACSLIWVTVLMLRPATAARLFWIGALSALTLGIRYQLLPVIGLLNLFALYAVGQRFGWILVGGTLVLIGFGLIDLVTWGVFLGSYIENFRLNFTESISHYFGTHPIYLYVQNGFLETGGVGLGMVIGVVLIWRRASPIWLSIVVGLVFFHIPAHKEIRFITWGMPFGAVTFTFAAFQTLTWLKSIPTLVRIAKGFIPFWVVVASVILLVFKFETFEQVRSVSDSHAVMRYLRNVPDLTGVEVRTDIMAWWRTGGYHTLDRAVPVYFKPPADNRAVSHIVTDGSSPGDGFEHAHIIGSLAIWQASEPRMPHQGYFDFETDNAVPDDAISTSPKPPRFPPFPTEFPVGQK